MKTAAVTLALCLSVATGDDRCIGGWQPGDGMGTSSYEKELGPYDSREACIDAVQALNDGPNAATYGVEAGSDPKACYAEYGQTTVDTSCSPCEWENCLLTATATPSRDLDGDGVEDVAPEGSCCISQYGVGFDTACGSTLAEVTANCCPSPFVARYHLTTEESTDSYDCVSFISKEDCNSYGQTWSGGDDDPIGLSAIGGCPHSAAALTTNSDVALACTNEEAALMSCVYAGHDLAADTTSWGTGLGWCSSALDYDLGTTSSVDECWTQCENKYGADLVAVDWTSMYGWCYCQNDCQCMEDVGRGDHLVASSSITALPGACSISGVLDDDFPETCSGVQEFVNEACGQAPSGCQNEYESYVTCLYEDRTAAGGLDCELTCAGALGAPYR